MAEVIKKSPGYPTKYKPSFCVIAEDFIGVQGKSIVQLARELRVSRDTIYEWANVHKEFSDTLTRAKDWAEAYWEDKFVSYMTNKDVNAPLIKLYFANRFKWHDKSEEAEDTGGDIIMNFHRGRNPDGS